MTKYDVLYLDGEKNCTGVFSSLYDYCSSPSAVFLCETVIIYNAMCVLWR